MLTNLFYYGHYRNYAARTVGGPTQRLWPAMLSEKTNRLTPGTFITLNKAHNDKIMDYAKDLSSGIVGFKDAAKMYLYDMHLIERNGSITFENHMRWIEEDLQNFISSYNNIQNTSRYGHSSELTHFAHYIRNFTSENSQILSHLGVVSYNGSGLSYHGMANTVSKETAMHAVDTFKAAYNATAGFLTQPLSQYMEFKDLNYYYNYSVGYTDNTFRLLQSGILLDVVV